MIRRKTKRKSSSVNSNSKRLKILSDLSENELKFESVTTYNNLNNEKNNSTLNEIRILLKDALYKCTECNVTCFNKFEHLFINHIEQNITCEECHKEFPIKNYFEHFYDCQMKLGYFCPICNAEFSNRQTLNKHENSCRNKFPSNNLHNIEKETPRNLFLSSCTLTNKNVSEVEIINLSNINEPSTTLVSEMQITSPNKKSRLIKKKKIILPKKKQDANEKQSKSNKKVNIVQEDTTIESTTNDFESVSDFDNEGLSNEDVILLKSDIPDILKIYKNRNVEKINRMYNDVKLLEYECKHDIVASPSNIAQYDCHMCLDFSSNKFSEFYVHLLEELNSISRKKEAQKRDNCVICGAVVPRNGLLAHVRMHKEHIQCKICKDYIPQNELESHLLSHRKHYSCRFCGDIFKSKASIRAHMSHHRKGTSYSCEECELAFCSLEKLVSHISAVHKSIEKTYTECIYCLELTDNIKNHIYSMAMCKLKCKTCLKVLKTNEEYANHIQSCDPEESKSYPIKKRLNVYKCKICGMKCRSFKRIGYHVKAHQIFSSYEEYTIRQQRVRCDLCQYEIPEQNLEAHKLQHLSNVKCKLCSQFVPKDEIIIHMETHKTESKCIDCAETFPTKSDLENHRKAHGKLIQRQCNFCELNFISEISRNKHMSLIHKRIDRDFVECNHCKELIMDQIDYHILNPSCCEWRCKLCDKRCPSLQDYKSHVSDYHEDILGNK